MKKFETIPDLICAHNLSAVYSSRPFPTSSERSKATTYDITESGDIMIIHDTISIRLLLLLRRRRSDERRSGVGLEVTKEQTTQSLK